MESNPFGLGYEQRLISGLLQDRNFFYAWLELFDPEYLRSPIYQVHCKLLKLFREKYNRPPDAVELEVLAQEYISQENTNDERAGQEWQLHKHEIAQYWKFGPSELEFVIDNAYKYIQVRAVERAIMTGAKLVGTPEVVKLPDMMQQALNVGTRMNSLGMDYFAERRARALKRYSTPRESNRIPFFIPKFDEAIGGVGYRARGSGIPELLMFAGGPNVGKSKAIAHMVKVAAILGKHVFVFSSEMAEDLYADRLDMGIGILDTPGIYDPNNFYHLQKRLDMFANQGARVFIKKFPAGTATIRETGALARVAEQTLGIDFSLLAWDYSGEFRAENIKAERREQLASIIRDQVRVKDEFECAGVGAFQLNREGMGAEMADLQHAAEDITPARVADMICVLAQTEEEYRKDPPEQRWCMRKVRSEEKNQEVLLIDDRKHMRMIQHPQQA